MSNLGPTPPVEATAIQLRYAARCLVLEYEAGGEVIATFTMDRRQASHMAGRLSKAANDLAAQEARESRRSRS